MMRAPAGSPRAVQPSRPRPPDRRRRRARRTPRERPRGTRRGRRRRPPRAPARGRAGRRSLRPHHISGRGPVPLPASPGGGTGGGAAKPPLVGIPPTSVTGQHRAAGSPAVSAARLRRSPTARTDPRLRGRRPEVQAHRELPYVADLFRRAVPGPSQGTFQAESEISQARRQSCSGGIPCRENSSQRVDF